MQKLIAHTSFASNIPAFSVYNENVDKWLTG